MMDAEAVVSKFRLGVGRNYSEGTLPGFVTSFRTMDVEVGIVVGPGGGRDEYLVIRDTNEDGQICTYHNYRFTHQVSQESNLRLVYKNIVAYLLWTEVSD